jgi:hypothetical protein
LQAARENLFIAAYKVKRCFFSFFSMSGNNPNDDEENRLIKLGKDEHNENDIINKEIDP